MDGWMDEWNLRTHPIHTYLSRYVFVHIYCFGNTVLFYTFMPIKHI